jgi:hypothetical protein
MDVTFYLDVVWDILLWYLTDDLWIGGGNCRQPTSGDLRSGCVLDDEYGMQYKILFSDYIDSMFTVEWPYKHYRPCLGILRKKFKKTSRCSPSDPCDLPSLLRR